MQIERLAKISKHLEQFHISPFTTQNANAFYWDQHKVVYDCEADGKLYFFPWKVWHAYVLAPFSPINLK